LGKLGKGQPDSSIIPPISVLIVDGTDFKFTPHCPPNRVY
jgi:hypothetical protein